MTASSPPTCLVSRAGERRGGRDQNAASIKCENRIQQLLGEKYQVKGTPLRSETAGSQKSRAQSTLAARRAVRQPDLSSTGCGELCPRGRSRLLAWLFSRRRAARSPALGAMSRALGTPRNVWGMNMRFQGAPSSL